MAFIFLYCPKIDQCVQFSGYLGLLSGSIYIDWRNDFWVCPFPIKRSTTPSKFSVLLMPPQLELGAARLTFVTCLYRDTMHVSVQAHCPHVKCLYRHTVHVSHCCSGTLCTCNVPVQADGARVTCLYRTGTGTVCHVSRVRRGVFIPCPRWIVISCGYPALSSALPAQV